MLLGSYQNDLLEAGVDEAGRGCYAGPVCAAAVILPKGFHHSLLNDSKQVKPGDRRLLREYIEEHALCWAVQMVDNRAIDRTNILKATYRAMHSSIASLNTKPGLLLIDGNRFKAYPSIRHITIVKGDAIYASIAAASILAKTHRDDYMMEIHKQYPQYGWQTNMGYGTLEHRNAIEVHGLTPFHRRSFNILNSPGLFD